MKKDLSLLAVLQENLLNNRRYSNHKIEFSKVEPNTILYEN